MKIQLGEDIIRIDKTKSNNYVNSHWNLYFSDIKINDEWYLCQILCFDKYIEIYNPKKLNKETGNFDQPAKGLYKKIETPFFKNQLIKYLLHKHPINRFSYNVRTLLTERKNTIFVILVALILSVTYYFANKFNNDIIIKYIAENNFIQSIIIFLTVSSFINIFYPFTLKKQMEKKDIENITRETIEEDEINKKIEKNSSF